MRRRGGGGGGRGSGERGRRGLAETVGNVGRSRSVEGFAEVAEDLYRLLELLFVDWIR